MTQRNCAPKGAPTFPTTTSSCWALGLVERIGYVRPIGRGEPFWLFSVPSLPTRWQQPFASIHHRILWLSPPLYRESPSSRSRQGCWIIAWNRIRRTRVYALRLARTIFNNYFDTPIHYFEGRFIALNVCCTRSCYRSNKTPRTLSESMNHKISFHSHFLHINSDCRKICACVLNIFNVNIFKI